MIVDPLTYALSPLCGGSFAVVRLRRSIDVQIVVIVPRRKRGFVISNYINNVVVICVIIFNEKKWIKISMAHMRSPFSCK